MDKCGAITCTLHDISQHNTHLVNPLSPMLQRWVVAAGKTSRAVRGDAHGIAGVQERVRIRVESEGFPSWIYGGVHAARVRLFTEKEDAAYIWWVEVWLLECDDA